MIYGVDKNVKFGANDWSIGSDTLGAVDDILLSVICYATDGVVLGIDDKYTLETLLRMIDEVDNALIPCVDNGSLN